MSWEAGELIDEAKILLLLLQIPNTEEAIRLLSEALAQAQNDGEQQVLDNLSDYNLYSQDDINATKEHYYHMSQTVKSDLQREVEKARNEAYNLKNGY